MGVMVQPKAWAYESLEIAQASVQVGNDRLESTLMPNGAYTIYACHRDDEQHWRYTPISVGKIATAGQ